MGLFDSSSTTTSNYNDNRLAGQSSGASSPITLTKAGDNSSVVLGDDGSYHQSGGNNFQAGSTVIKDGGSNNTIYNLSGDVAIASLNNMQKVSEAAIASNLAASGTIAKTISDMESKQTASAAQQSADQTSAMTTLLSAVTDLGKTTATGGQSDMNKTFLYIALAGFAALAAVAYFFFKK